jgi:hypothetical protein
MPVRATTAAPPLRINWDRGGYTWVVETHLDRTEAEHSVQFYRDFSYPVGISVDRLGGGSTAYRIVLGQFGTEGAALRANRWIQKNAPRRIWLLWLPGHEG